MKKLISCFFILSSSLFCSEPLWEKDEPFRYYECLSIHYKLDVIDNLIHEVEMEDLTEEQEMYIEKIKVNLYMIRISVTGE